jgi:mono/diheme cytochrome c family protein
MKISRQLFLLMGSTMLGLSLPCPAAAVDDGAKVYTDACSPCHTVKIRPLDNKQLTKEQWKEAIDRMIDQGAEVPKGKMSELLDYLSRTHGPVGTATDAGKK